VRARFDGGGAVVASRDRSSEMTAPMIEKGHAIVELEGSN
jgi:hypothetical protein